MTRYIYRSPCVSPAPEPPSRGDSAQGVINLVNPSDGPDGTAWGPGADGSYAFLYQKAFANPLLPPMHATFSESDSLGYVALDTSSRDGKLGLPIATLTGVDVTRPRAFAIDEKKSYALNQTIAEWGPQAAGDPRFVQLELQSDSRSNRTFRARWHVRMPHIIRLWCGLFDRVAADHRGIVLIDDSARLGAKTWQTR